MSRIFKRGYEVRSGPWPFYRLALLFLFIGTIVQFVKVGVPDSVRDGLPAWHGWALFAMYSWGAGLVLVAVIGMRQNLLALNIERSGSWFLWGGLVIYYGNFFWTSGIPTTPQSWMMMSLIFYLPFRIKELSSEIYETVKEKNKEFKRLKDQKDRGS